MNVNEFLTLLTRAVYVLIGLVTLLSWLRYRDRARFDIALVFLSFAATVITQEINRYRGVNDPTVALLGSLVFVAQPYLLLRVVDHFRRVHAWVRWVGLAGMIVSWLLLIGFGGATMPALLVIVIWFVVIEGYAAFAFIRGAFNTAGVTRARMKLAALGTALVALLIGAAGVSAAAPALAPYVTAVTQFFSLLSAVSYYLGFAPPHLLRHWWQSAELYHFLHEVNRIAPDKRGREVLERLSEAAHRAVGALASVIVQWSERTQQLQIVCTRSSDRAALPDVSYSPNEGIVGQAWQERRAVVARTLAPAAEGSRQIVAHVGAQSLIAVPIATAQHAWGVLIVFLRREPLFADDDVNLLNLFVEQTGVILDHEALLTEQRAQTSRANALAEISQSLSEVKSDYQSVLDLIAQRLSELIGDACVITLLSKDRQTILPVALFHPDPKGLELMRAFAPPRETLAQDSTRAKVIRTGRAVRIEQVPQEKLREQLEPHYHQYLAQHGLHSLLIVPLRVQGRVIGTLGVSRDRPGNPYTSADEKLMQDIADRAALAIANAQEFAEREQAEQALRESEERFAKAFRASPAAIVITRRDNGAFMDANESWERLFGYTREETVGRTSGDLNIYVSPEQREQFWQAINEQRRVRDVEMDMRTKSGEMRHMLISVEPMQVGDVPALLGILYDISERQRAEEALRRQAHMLAEQARLLELAHDAIFVRELDGTLKFWNHGAEEMYGWSKDEALGQRTSSLLDTKYPQPLNDIIGELMMKGRWEGELEHQRRDGKRIVVASRWALQRDDDGKPHGILEINNDITERKQAETALRTQTNLYESFLKAQSDLGDGVSITQGARFVHANEALAHIYGYSVNELLALPSFLDLVVPEQREELAQRLRQRLNGDALSDHGETTVLNKNGKRVNIEYALKVMSVNGSAQIFSIVRDVTERKQAEQALLESELRFRSVTQSASDSIISADQYGSIISWNAGAQKTFGYSEQEVLNQPITMLMPPRYREAHRLALERAHMMGETRLMGQTLELHGLRRDGTEFPLELSLSDWFIRGERFYTGILRDVTVRQQAEQELRRTASELARSNADLEQFAYVASHDLQEPLQMVSSFVQLLKRRYAGKLDQDADEFIHYAVDGATRMQTLINDLLDYSRVGTRGKELHCVDGEQVLAQTLLNLRLTLEEQHALVTHDALPNVMGDESQLIQLFQNLIANGVKFHGGQPPWVHVSATPADGNWQFCVRDNGIGIDPPYFERIFTLFQRLHKRGEYPGTGIGLAVCKKIVERHGGHIWVESQTGQGAAFYFTLPAMPEKAELPSRD